MAKAQNPFMSVEAKGSFANLLTSFKHSGKVYIIKKNTRRGVFVGSLSGFGRIYFGRSFFGYLGKFNYKTKSQEQGAQRILFANAWRAWGQLSEFEKQEYTAEAENLKMTGPNLFMSQFYKL